MHRQYIALEENHLFSSNTVNNFRVGVNRYLERAQPSVTAINPAVSDTSLGFLSGTSAGSIKIGGLTMFSGGLGGVQIQQHEWEDYQAYDDVLVTRGIHSIKFGGGIERDEQTY